VVTQVFLSFDKGLLSDQTVAKGPAFGFKFISSNIVLVQIPLLVKFSAKTTAWAEITLNTGKP